MNVIKDIYRKSRLKKDIDDIRFTIGQSHMRNIRSRYGSINSLHDVDFKVFSQYGEDGILDYLLERLEIKKPFFIEVGTENYSESNTRFLFQDRSCFGIIVDSDKKLKEKSMNILGKYYFMGEIHPINLFVNKENIIQIYDRARKEGNIDLFSLDIDGVDYWIIASLPNKFCKIAVVEFNPYFGSILNITVPYISNFERTAYHYSNLAFGASLRAIINIMKGKGFKFIGTNINNNNAFFVVEELASKLSILSIDTKDLSPFTKNYSRESRDTKGNLTFLGGSDRLNAIKDCEVIDLNTQTQKKISQLVNGFM